MKQESRQMMLLEVILRLQHDPPIPLTFKEIYEQIQKEDPKANLSKTWVYRVLNKLTKTGLIRVENPASHRNKYIADVNTIMAGFEQLKSTKIEELEKEKGEIEQNLERISMLDCGNLAKRFVRELSGREEEVSSRVVRGVDELHRILRFNMLDNAGQGDIIRATLLWIEPFINETSPERIAKFFEAAERGAEIRYMVTAEFFQADKMDSVRGNLEGLMGLMQQLLDLRSRGKEFDGRIYMGPKTYNQVSFNRESMALIIAENPLTATWITRKFNPDLIDNAVKTFDREWKKAKSILDLTPKDFDMLKVEPDGLMSRVLSLENNSKQDEED